MRTPITLALSAILVGVACNQDGPTDVQRKAPAAAVVGAPSFAVGGNKPITGYEIRKDSLDAGVGGQTVVEVYCPAGKRALGGGFKVGGGAQINDGDVAIYESTPRVTAAGQTDGWRVEAVNRSSIVRQIQSWVICAPI
jgi:hypothetical protein